MAEQHDDDEKPPVDPDRAAILERRKRFIAFALTGLSTAACEKPLGKPDPCLKYSIEKGEKGEKGEEGEKGPKPQPCLSVPIQEDPPQEPPPQDPPPQVCLKMAAPPDTEGDTAQPAEPEPRPQPCLSVPRPCLKQASPG